MCLHYSLSLQARGSFTAECLCRVFTSKMQSCSILTCLENVCFSLNILYADLSLWNIYYREIPEEGVVWLYCLFCFCVVSCNYSKQSKSHQATFEANWVCVRNGFCHQAWRMCRVEVVVPLVAAGCNCRVAFYPQGSWRYWWSKCTEAPSRPVEDSREPLWPQCSWWALIFKFEVFDCFLLEVFLY